MKILVVGNCDPAVSSVIHALRKKPLDRVRLEKACLVGNKMLDSLVFKLEKLGDIGSEGDVFSLTRKGKWKADNYSVESGKHVHYRSKSSRRIRKYSRKR